MKVTFSLPKTKDKKKQLSSFFKKIYPFFSFSLLIIVLCLCSLVLDFKNDEEKVLGKSISFRELLPTPAWYPVDKNLSSFPSLSANTIKVIDADSYVTLYEKNPNQRVFPASTTKMMTAIVALEQYQLDEVLTVGKTIVDGNIIMLEPGEQLTMENVLYGLLVGSGNDAALVLAENYPGGVTNFVRAMNQKAKELSLNNTHFTNPMGYDQEGHYSTAEDLSRLASYAMKNQKIAKIVSNSEYTISDVTGNKIHKLKNTNELVGQINGVKGVKTGWTENAGECLVSYVEKDNRKIISTILGSNDRFGETKSIIDWAFTNFEWKKISPYSF